ncbi:MULTISPECIES: L7Ae/L30e/S12e/Gadd45 family ribosomal protein [Loigolactobacillus]|uniref:50S ribosomal protein L7 n=2 Tax=Loigolactobacillus backii TaxID=375175 RepID=A0A192H3E7_9LACO|nr:MULTISPECIES: ribosomal L7Ae/L30e/S12e/Gadd45 family protein [Loigolactobacillus]ANK59651.1 50S ribosomal protein L7 [Loigolactobacillus backii]ANK62783.1 50S ribosomal protein L7 [Loigolactobacillus backii]ANK64645.1 50S ribosomal protein L7 [Loigolactobacillus backii]ANK66959.1 50S ribosomal protein L7 [Loigolactobacillus backii]ANK70209.1 50S ribosomal protein L7 [Loigolactobacillus backii]
MLSNQKALNLLGLSLRAGQLVMGEGLVIKAIQQEKAKLVLVATDASQATQAKFAAKGDTYSVPVLNAFTKEAMSQALGRPRTIIAVVDQGFAKRLIALLNTQGA